MDSDAHFSFTRAAYDKCALDKKNQESAAPFQWVTDTGIVENPKACFTAQSPFMQNPFYSIPASSVDTESQLRRKTWTLTHCPSRQYNPMQNCAACDNCQSGIPCGCAHCKDIREKLNTLECNEPNALVPEYTRTNRSCNVLSGVSINRFNPLYHDVQKLDAIHDNSYIGTNTRLALKDIFKARYQFKKSPSYQ